MELGNAFRHFEEGIAESKAVVILCAAGGACKHQFIRNDIRFMACLHASEGVCQAVGRIDGTHAVGTKFARNGNEAFDRALCHVRTGSVAALPVKLHAEEVSSGQCTSVKDADLSCRKIPHDMGTEAAIDMDSVIAEVAEKRRNASFPHFLSLFEHEDDLSFPFILVLGKDFGFGKEHRHMAVMAAGMHDAFIF